MSTPATLPLSTLVNVSVYVSPQSPPVPTFNQGLIIGNSTVIPTVGANSRIRQYTTLAQMLSDGFTVNSPEYIGAQIYFSQTPAPTILWVGRQDLTSLATVVPHAAQQGTGYKVGDLLTVVQGGGSGGVVAVTSVGGGGNVTGVSIFTDGTGYTVANGLATTGGSGTNAQVDISAIGETPLVAVTNCRTANFQWWGVVCLTAVKADHEAIAGYLQSASPASMYFYQTSDADALANQANNVFAYMLANNYNRCLGFWSSTQGGAFPNNIYIACAALGVTMGLNNGLANSAFTAMFKTLTGIAPEPLTPTQIGNIATNNGNVYLSYANAYKFMQTGVLGNGQFFDEVLNLDMLTSQIQYNIMNLLTSSTKIPQTDAGQSQLIHAVNQAAEAARIRGFIAGGVWNGVQIINLTPGKYISNGYLAQSFPYATQLQSDRQARKSMPIYLAIIEAGAVQSVVIGVYVQR